MLMPTDLSLAVRPLDRRSGALASRSIAASTCSSVERRLEPLVSAPLEDVVDQDLERLLARQLLAAPKNARELDALLDIEGGDRLVVDDREHAPVSVAATACGQSRRRRRQSEHDRTGIRADCEELSMLMAGSRPIAVEGHIAQNCGDYLPKSSLRPVLNLTENMTEWLLSRSPSSSLSLLT